MQPFATKVFSDRARESALAVRRHQAALGPSAATGGMANPKIRARVAEILAAKQKKAKVKAAPKGKGKKAPDPAKAKAKADRAKETAAKKQEREKAKLARDMERTGKQATRETARKQKVAERATAAQAKQAAQQKKLKQAAAAKKEKAKAAAGKQASAQAKQGERAQAIAARQKLRERTQVDRTAATKEKQAAAQQHKTRVLSEKIKRGEKLSASDQVDAEDAGLVKRAGKAMDFAIKQSDEERAMFAKLSGGRGKGKGYDKSKSKLTTGKEKGGGGDTHVDPAHAPTGHPSRSRAYSPEGLEAHARSGNQGFLGFEHENGMRVLIQTNTNKKGTPVRGTHRITVHHASGGYTETQTNNANSKHFGQQLKDRGMIYVSPHVSLGGTKALGDIDMDDEILDLDDLAIKAGARHSKLDASHLDEAARHLHAAGATCPDCAPDDDTSDVLDDDASKAIKSIMDNPQWYASHECNDIAQAASGLSTLVMLIQSELSEEDEDDKSITQLVDAARTLIDFIGGELDELEGAASDAADGKTAGDVPMAKAWGGAVKAADDGSIAGLGVLYATKTTHDLEKDYYDKNTDLWLDHWGWPRPITYHHGMDKGTRDDPVIGHWTKATVTDEGVWLEGQLDRAHRYYKAIKELAQRGYLKISSDSGPQWVIREPQSNGANYIKRWPLVSASLTVTPMEPRMFPVEVKALLAELGYEAIANEEPEAVNPESARRDGVKADDERARRILLEIECMELMEETAR